MIVTIKIKDDRLEEFYRMVEENHFREETSEDMTIQSHLDEALRREKDPVLSQVRLWSEARQRYF